MSKHPRRELAVEDEEQRQNDDDRRHDSEREGEPYKGA